MNSSTLDSVMTFISHIKSKKKNPTEVSVPIIYLLLSLTRNVISSLLLLIPKFKKHGLVLLGNRFGIY